LGLDGRLRSPGTRTGEWGFRMHPRRKNGVDMYAVSSVLPSATIMTMKDHQGRRYCCNSNWYRSYYTSCYVSMLLVTLGQRLAVCKGSWHQAPSQLRRLTMKDCLTFDCSNYDGLKSVRSYWWMTGSHNNIFLSFSCDFFSFFKRIVGL
jgi:hypothetical protein